LSFSAGNASLACGYEYFALRADFYLPFIFSNLISTLFLLLNNLSSRIVAYFLPHYLIYPTPTLPKGEGM